MHCLPSLFKNNFHCDWPCLCLNILSITASALAWLFLFTVFWRHYFFIVFEQINVLMIMTMTNCLHIMYKDNFLTVDDFLWHSLCIWTNSSNTTTVIYTNNNKIIKLSHAVYLVPSSVNMLICVFAICLSTMNKIIWDWFDRYLQGMDTLWTWREDIIDVFMHGQSVSYSND